MLLPHCIPKQPELPKAAVLFGCCFAEWFVFALCYQWMRNQDHCSRPAERAVTSWLDSMQELLSYSSVGRRGQIPGRTEGSLENKCFSLVQCCIGLCQPTRCGLQWVSCVVSMDGRTLRGCCAGTFQKSCCLSKHKKNEHCFSWRKYW